MGGRATGAMQQRDDGVGAAREGDDEDDGGLQRCPSSGAQRPAAGEHRRAVRGADEGIAAAGGPSQ
eukprot:857849-Pyramimonas_sp.AAC.1